MCIRDRLCGAERQIGTIEPGKIANLTVVEGNSYFDPEAPVRAVWIDGRVHPTPAAAPKAASEVAKQEAKPAAAGSEKPAGMEAAKKKEQLRECRKARVARSPLEGRGPLAEPGAVLIEGATVWTCATNGMLTNAQVCLLYTSPSPRDRTRSRMPSSA